MQRAMVLSALVLFCVGCAPPDQPDGASATRLAELTAENAQLRAELKQLRARLRAIQRPDAPELSEDIAALRFRGLVRNSDGSNSIGNYTVTGPVKSSLRPIGNHLTKLAVDTQYERVFGRGHHDVYLVPERGEPSKIAQDPDLEEISWLSAIAFDTKRGRLLASTFGGGGNLYAYEADGGEWSIICSPGLAVRALAYAEPEDVLYGVNLDSDSVTTVMTFNSQGARTSEVKLSDAIKVGGDFGHTQLLWDKGWLLLIQSPSDRKHPPARGYLIQPDTGEVRLSSELLPE